MHEMQKSLKGLIKEIGRHVALILVLFGLPSIILIYYGINLFISAFEILAAITTQEILKAVLAVWAFCGGLIMLLSGVEIMLIIFCITLRDAGK